jgi:hypothetical protein
MNTWQSFLSWIFDGYWPTPDTEEELPVRIAGERHDYTRQFLFAAGDVADLYLAAANDATDALAPYLLKAARLREGNAHLESDQRALTKLCVAARGTTYARYLAPFEESVARVIPTRRVNVFRFDPAYHTLEQVHAQHRALDGVHLAWIFNRLLTVLGFCHRQRIVHGAVLPCHALIDTATHGLRLVGWGQSVAVGQPIAAVPTRFWDWYPPEVHRKQPVGPATDLFLAARCIVYLAGGDPVTNWMPETVPPPLQRFLSTCLVESPRMRPEDAWALQEDFACLLRSLYGPPKFHELTLT